MKYLKMCESIHQLYKVQSGHNKNKNQTKCKFGLQKGFNRWVYLDILSSIWDTELEKKISPSKQNMKMP